MMNNIKSCCVCIGGIFTDITIQLYSNRIFMVASQFEKLGSMVTVNREASLHQFITDIHSTKILFGQDNEEIHAAARFISEKIDIDRPLLLSICLKDYSKDTLDTIVEAVDKIKLW